MAHSSRVTWQWTAFDERVVVLQHDDDEPDPRLSDPRPLHEDIAKIDESIKELEDKLRMLRMQRLKLLGEHALINKFPPEILSRVFELGNHEDQAIMHTIPLVSKLWRQVSLETPTLWSYVRLDKEWVFGHDVEFQRKVKVYMERSQAARILVDLDFRYCETLEGARAMMQCLQPHMHRCFAFRACVADWDWMSVVKEYTAEMGPALEEFALRIDPGDSEDSSPVPMLTGTYPCLRTITLEQTPLACVRADIPNLQHFYITKHSRYSASQRIRITLREMLAAVTKTDSITDIWLQSVMFSVDGTEPVFRCQPELVIPQLTDLSISFVDSTSIGLFLDSVSLPSLFRLTVQMETGPEGDNLGWLTRMANTCAKHVPNLRQLELCAVNVDGAGLAPFVRALHQMPQLSALGISAPHGGSLGAKIFDLLAAGPDRLGHWLLPNLEALSVSGCRDVSGHELLRVIRARKDAQADGVSAIRTLRVVPIYPLDAEIVESLKDNVEVLKITPIG